MNPPARPSGAPSIRVLIFYQYFTTPQGAWSTRWYEFARRWVEAGVSVTIVTSVYDKSDLRPSHWIEREMIDGIQVVTVGVRQANRHGRALRIATYGLYALGATWFALRESADVVIASSGPLSVGLPGLVAKWIRRLPLVFEVRDLWPEGAIQLGLLTNRVLIRAARWFEEACYRGADQIVALSPGMAAGVLNVTPTARVEVLPNPADTDRFHPADPREVGREVVYAGSLGVMDDGGQIVALAAELARRGRGDIRITVLGDGKERAELESRAAALALTNIRFDGLRPKIEVAARLRTALCALVTFGPVPVLDTVSPNKLFDALASGVPVVQTTSGWIRSLLEEYECGLTAPARDPVAMADAVIRIADDPALRARMSSNARRLAEAEFGVAHLADRYLELVRAVDKPIRK